MPESVERADATGLPKFTTLQFVGGVWREGSGPERQIKSPYDGSLLAIIRDASKQELDDAVKAARDAFENKSWRKLTVSERGKLIWKLADLIEERTEEFAQLETLDNGKPLAISRTCRAVSRQEIGV